MITTRSKSDDKHFIFGEFCQFPTSQLPTDLDVLKNIHFTKLQYLRANETPSDTQVYKHVYNGISEIWDRAGIPIRDFESARKKMIRLLQNKSIFNADKHPERYQKDHDKEKIRGEF